MRLDSLKIAYVLEATAGGTRKHVRDLAFGMLLEGAEIMLAVSPGREPDYGDDITSFSRAGMEVAVIPMGREISPLKDPRCAFGLWRYLSRFRPQVIHTHAAKAGALGRMLAPLIPGATFIHTPHTLPFEWASTPAASFYRLLEGLLGRFTDAIIALTKAQKERLIEAHVATAGQVVVIPNGVGPMETLRRDQVRREWGTSEEDILVLQVARLAPQKACGAFLEAAHRLRAEKALRFVLIGDGPMRNELQTRCRTLGLDETRFTMPGYLPKAWARFPAADILVLTSLYEGLPYVILEAMSLGVAVIASDIPGMREVLEDGQDGLLVPAGDAEALAEAIRSLAASRDKRQALSRRGMEKVRARYRRQDFLEAHVNLYARLGRR